MLYIESGYDVESKSYLQPDYCLQNKSGRLIASFDLKVKIDALQKRTTKEVWWGKTHWNMVAKYDRYHCILNAFRKKLSVVFARVCSQPAFDAVSTPRRFCLRKLQWRFVGARTVCVF